MGPVKFGTPVEILRSRTLKKHRPLSRGLSTGRKGLGPLRNPEASTLDRSQLSVNCDLCGSPSFNPPVLPSVLPPHHRRQPANWIASYLVATTTNRKVSSMKKLLLSSVALVGFTAGAMA